MWNDEGERVYMDLSVCSSMEHLTSLVGWLVGCLVRHVPRLWLLAKLWRCRLVFLTSLAYFKMSGKITAFAETKTKNENGLFTNA